MSAESVLHINQMTLNKIDELRSILHTRAAVQEVENAS